MYVCLPKCTHTHSERAINHTQTVSVLSLACLQVQRQTLILLGGLLGTWLICLPLSPPLLKLYIVLCYNFLNDAFVSEGREDWGDRPPSD